MMSLRGRRPPARSERSPSSIVCAETWSFRKRADGSSKRGLAPQTVLQFDELGLASWASHPLSTP